MVAKGDNTRVKCSYSRSECKLDKDVHRISNGFFNYVGKSDPSLWGQVPVLVMCHTRELAFQISKEYERFSKFLPAIKVGPRFRKFKKLRIQTRLQSQTQAQLKRRILQLHLPKTIIILYFISRINTHI